MTFWGGDLVVRLIICGRAVRNDIYLSSGRVTPCSRYGLGNLHRRHADQFRNRGTFWSADRPDIHIRGNDSSQIHVY
jgi:hypothetical protein